MSDKEIGMMRSFSIAIFMVVAGFTTSSDVAASSTIAWQAAKLSRCNFPKSKKTAPAWVCSGQIEGVALSAVGSAAKSKAGISFMEKMAVANARVNLIRKVRKNLEQVSREGKNLDVGIEQSTIDETIESSRIYKKAFGPDGKLYVLIGLDQNGVSAMNASAVAHEKKE